MNGLRIGRYFLAHHSDRLHQAGEICADVVTRAHFEDAEYPAHDFLAGGRGRLRNCAGGSAFEVFSGRQFYRCLAGACDELGSMGCDLLSIAFCSL